MANYRSAEARLRAKPSATYAFSQKRSSIAKGLEKPKSLHPTRVYLPDSHFASPRKQIAGEETVKAIATVLIKLDV